MRISLQEMFPLDSVINANNFKTHLKVLYLFYQTGLSHISRSIKNELCLRQRKIPVVQSDVLI